MKKRLSISPIKKYSSVIVACIVGIVIFLAVYGYQVLVPTNVDWLIAGGDLSQHYIGWQFFRQSAWTFPIGIASDLAYPHGLAITFMDSIPLAAISAKVFTPILPEYFQYFGWWGLASFVAMAGFTALIIRRWTSDFWVIVLAAIFFCLSPILFQRMFNHTALASQWIIMLAIYAFVAGRQWSVRKSIAVWSGILSLSVLIHPYFLLMTGFVMVLALIWRYVSIGRLLLELTVPIVAALFATWIIGGLTVASISGMNFGKAGYDLLAPVVASGWSIAQIVTLPIHGESFLYIGFGGLLLLTIAMSLVAMRTEGVKKIVKVHKARIIWMTIVVIGLVVFSLSPVVHSGGTDIFAYSIPTFVEKIWAVFRVTARMMWPIYYLVLVGALVVVIKNITRPVRRRIVIALIALLQIIDITGSPMIQTTRERFKDIARMEYVSSLSDPQWNTLIQGKKHIVYLGDLYDSDFVTVSQFAIRHHMTLNTGYFARKPTVAIERTIQLARSNVASGDIDSETVYMSKTIQQASESVVSKQLDGYIVYTNK